MAKPNYKWIGPGVILILVAAYGYGSKKPAGALGYGSNPTNTTGPMGVYNIYESGGILLGTAPYAIALMQSQKIQGSYILPVL